MDCRTKDEPEQHLSGLADRSRAADVLLREEPDEEEDDEEEHNGDEEGGDGDEGYSE